MLPFTDSYRVASNENQREFTARTPELLTLSVLPCTIARLRSSRGRVAHVHARDIGIGRVCFLPNLNAVENYPQLPGILLRDHGIGSLAPVIFDYRTQHQPFAKEATNVRNHGLHETGLRAVRCDV